MTKNTGGPAFPSHGTMGEVSHEGMTLHDCYVGKVLQGLFANPGGPIQASDMSGWRLVNCTLEQLVDFAREVADIAVAAREAPAMTNDQAAVPKEGGRGKGND